MLDSVFGELLLVILGLVESYNQVNSEFLEDWYIIVRSERSVFICNI
jgi:hypothetical protein